VTVTPTLAIIGGSLAGAKAAEGARRAGFEGRVVLIGEESEAPYSRPPLSKAVLRGEAGLETTRIHEDSFYVENEIEIVVDDALGLDTAGRAVELSSGSVIRFDTAVLATGAAPRALDVPGADLDGVHYLRTSDDAVRARDALRAAKRVVVIGAGWIGTEVAASARHIGAEVTVVAPGQVPLQRVLGVEIGGVFGQLHEANGVTLRMGSHAAELRGAKRVESLVLDDGRVIPADLVVVAIGVTPRTELADAAAGLRVDNGIVVDQFLETSIPGIYAAGDVANAWHPHYRQYIRIEHWANARNQGLTAGGNAAGNHDLYELLPHFFSQQYDVGLEYVGHSGADDEVVVRGDAASRSFIAFWHNGGIVTAAMNVNVAGVADDLTAIVTARERADVGRLANPSVALSELV
jgi:3-phenylpropionate/trans-cinnamate dioxygenase ferredoxin reductase component